MITTTIGKLARADNRVTPSVAMSPRSLQGRFLHELFPVRLTTCGLPGALSLMSSVPVSVCELVDESPIRTVQEFPAIRLELQVFVSLNGDAVVMPVMFRSALPKSLKVMGCGGVDVHRQKQKPPRHSSLQEMDRVGVDKVALGPLTTPMPFKAIDCGLPAALLVTVSAAVRGPNCAGAKVMLIEHVVPGAKLKPQVSVSEKSVGFVPVKAMPLMFMGCVPTLVSVTSCAALVICSS